MSISRSAISNIGRSIARELGRNLKVPLGRVPLRKWRGIRAILAFDSSSEGTTGKGRKGYSSILVKFTKEILMVDEL